MEGPGIDISELLRRVVTAVFGESARVEYSQPVGGPHIYRARISEFEGRGTDVGLEASHEWFEAWILDLDPSPSAIVFFDDADEGYMESLLRALAGVLRSYARGEGRVEFRPSLIRRQPIPRFVLADESGKWVLGRRTSLVPNI